MNAAAIPSPGAVSAIASYRSDNITRIAPCLRNDDGAEKKNNAVLPCGIIFKPPQNDNGIYSKEEIQLLGKIASKDNIFHAIKTAVYRPGRSAIFRYLKDVKQVLYSSLSAAEKSEVRDMIVHDPMGIILASVTTEESAAEVTSDVPPPTNISRAVDTTFQSASSLDNVIATSQAEPSTSEIEDLDITLLDGPASNRPGTVTPENVPTDSSTCTPCVVEESTTTTTSSSSGQKRRPATSTHTSSDATVPPNNILDNHNSSNKRSKTSEKTSEAAKILCPRFMASVSNTTNGSISIEWKALDKSVGDSTIIADANILEIILKVISKGDPGRAASILNRVLKRTSNSPLAKAVVLPSVNSKNADADAHVKDCVIRSIHACMRHHTPNEAGGTRTIPAETLVKNIALACVFDAPNTCTHAALARVIGTTANQIDHARYAKRRGQRKV